MLPRRARPRAVPRRSGEGLPLLVRLLLVGGWHARVVLRRRHHMLLNRHGVVILLEVGSARQMVRIGRQVPGLAYL